MIINIRGTSGSGKSTAVRSLMALFPEKTNIKIEGRKQPIGYVLRHPDREKSLYVLGHYETACGGCDTINGMDAIYNYVREGAAQGDVLFEGLLISAEINRTVQLHKDFPGQLLVLALDTPLDKCVASINERRWAKNPDKPPVAEKNTTSKFKGVQSCMRRFAAEGLDARWVDREQAVAAMREALKI